MVVLPELCWTLPPPLSRNLFPSREKATCMATAVSGNPNQQQLASMLSHNLIGPLQVDTNAVYRNRIAPLVTRSASLPNIVLVDSISDCACQPCHRV